MTKEQQLQRLDKYINWIKIDENYEIMKEFRYMYQSEYIEYLDRKKWMISKYSQSELYDKIIGDYDKSILNKIESLINK